MTSLYRVRTAITGGAGGPMLATHFYLLSGGTAQHAADASRGFWQDARTYIYSGYSMQVEPLVYTIDSTSGAAIGVTATSSTVVTGSDSGDPLPGLVQGLASWHTGAFVSGREVIGRTFIPGPTESQSVAGIPSSNYLATMTTAAFNWASATLSAPVVFSRAHHVAEVVTGSNIGTSWATLKSRRS
jgi:hypothetical protein